MDDQLTLEMKFPVQGTEIPSDHGYFLYSAICRLIPIGKITLIFKGIAVSPTKVYKDRMGV
jgi:hypothetical protein